jgi:hypothetical protein
MNLFSVDGTGPFFRGLRQPRTNWSGIPPHAIPFSGPAAQPFWRQLEADFATFTDRTARLGFHAVTLDSLAHPTDHPWQEPRAPESIAAFQGRLDKPRPLLAKADQRLFVTPDILTTNPRVEARLGKSAMGADSLFE